MARMIKEMDLQGVEDRKARHLSRRRYLSLRPNFCWHIDDIHNLFFIIRLFFNVIVFLYLIFCFINLSHSNGTPFIIIIAGYDKLKPYGFPIHGCICGYSRKILWLEVVKTNNDPRVPGRLFLDMVKELKGCPTMVRSDCGTENGVIAATQCFFRANATDPYAGPKSHVYGSSHANQRIEGWWSFLRRHRTSWWIDFFKDMVASNVLVLGNNFHIQCLWFCFSHLIQADLDKVQEQWNSHYIRRSRHDTLAGIPDLLYLLPEYYGASDCIFPVTNDQVEAREPHCQIDMEENMYQDYFEHVLIEMDLNTPFTKIEALDIFQTLVNRQN